MNAPATITDTLPAKINAEHEAAFGSAREALEHARRAGELLLEAKAALKHGEWLPWIESNCKFGERTARNYMQLATGWERLQEKSATVADLGLREALQLLDDTRPKGGMPYRGFSPEAYSTEWYTPPVYVEAAREVMGGIDIDPASCAEAQETVAAACYYSEAEDGLSKPWEGRTWINPPYGAAAQQFTDKLLSEYQAGKVTEAIILLNAFSVTAQWFRPLWDFTLCFASERVKFLRPGNEPGTAPANGSVFVYLGPSPEKFAQVYGQLGPVVQRFAA